MAMTQNEAIEYKIERFLDVQPVAHGAIHIYKSALLNFDATGYVKLGEIYLRLLSLNQDPLKAGSFFRIFRSVIAAGRSVQNQPGEAQPPPLYAVFGDPIGHSLSPVMHNSALAQTGLDGHYLAFRVQDIAAAVSGIRGLNIRGASITIPHKISVMNYLNPYSTSNVQLPTSNFQ